MAVRVLYSFKFGTRFDKRRGVATPVYCECSDIVKAVGFVDAAAGLLVYSRKVSIFTLTLSLYFDALEPNFEIQGLILEVFVYVL
jgi:hypothetical protein